MTEAVLVERIDRTTVVTINRPEARNSLTKSVVVGLAKAVAAAPPPATVRCIVVTGAGGHFCAGADIRRTLSEDPDAMEHLDAYLDAYHSVIKAIVRAPKPTIASIDGAAVGFGADIALACDLRVATTAAYVQEKFVNIGLMPDGGGTFWLPRLVGTARAMRAIMLSDKLDAKTLDELGLLVACVAPSELRASTLSLAKKIEDGPPLAFAEMKRAVYASWGDLDAALAREKEGQIKLLRTNDLMEGVMAWAQKRPPNFTGS